MNKNTDMERLEIKIMEILADYKFNSTQTETCEMVAKRIINIVKHSLGEMK